MRFAPEITRSGPFRLYVGQFPRSEWSKWSSTREVRCSGQVKSGPQGPGRQVGGSIDPPDRSDLPGRLREP